MASETTTNDAIGDPKIRELRELIGEHGIMPLSSGLSIELEHEASFYNSLYMEASRDSNEAMAEVLVDFAESLEDIARRARYLAIEHLRAGHRICWPTVS